MSNKNKVTLMPVFLSAVGILLTGAVMYYLTLPANEAEAISR